MKRWAQATLDASLIVNERQLTLFSYRPECELVQVSFGDTEEVCDCNDSLPPRQVAQRFWEWAGSPADDDPQEIAKYICQFASLAKTVAQRAADLESGNIGWD